MYNGYNWMQPQDDRLMVNDRNEAEKFLMAPNQIAHFWHRTEPVIYEKRTDANGIAAPLTIMRYTVERVKTKEEEYEARIKALEEMVQGLKGGANNAE